MHQTYSSTPLDAITVVQDGGEAHVWLRRDITHDWRDEPDGTSQEFWRADEVHGTMPAGTTAVDVAEIFDVLWTVFERTEMTEMEREVAQVSQEQSTAAILGDGGGGGYAPDNISEGDFFVAGGAAYVALCGIARGERLTPNANVQVTTIAKYIMEQSKDKE